MENGIKEAPRNKLIMDRVIIETERCINCGFCEIVCPTYVASGYDATHSIRKRVQLARAICNDV
ncbi:4Fe-4S binding protein [Oxyplasma meridianum]|uniref:4Fe-4S binding protein n=1 Tax=Oxyplasma meridianum TaxID=3073602 RepID=A0AAX4NHM2_9ARCH